MMLTLFTDASLCGETNAAGYGAWFKRNDMKLGQSFGGEIVGSVTNSGEAEIYAIAHALDVLGRKGFLHHPTKTVMVQSDSVRALQLLLQLVPGAREAQHQSSRIGRITPKNPLAASPVERGACFVAQDALSRVETLVRHVKGHQRGGGRSWVNRECDTLARFYMSAVRLRKEAGGIAP